MKCTCGKEIDPDRLEFLMEEGKEVCCRDCSEEQKKVSFMVYSHKTAPTMMSIPASNTEAIRQAKRANRRAR